MSKAGDFVWTDEAIETVIKLHLEGKTAAEIGRQFNITRNAIIGKISRLKAAGRCPEPSDLVLLRKKQHNKLTLISIRKTMERRNNPPPLRLTPKPKPKPVLRLVQKPVEVTPVPEIIAPMGAYTQPLHSLRRKGCRWIAESPPKGRMDEALMCGETQHENSPYCAYHRKMALYPMTSAERAKAARAIVRAGKWDTMRK